MERTGIQNSTKSEGAKIKLLELEAQSIEVKTIGEAKAKA